MNKNMKRNFVIGKWTGRRVQKSRGKTNGLWLMKFETCDQFFMRKSFTKAIKKEAEIKCKGGKFSL